MLYEKILLYISIFVSSASLIALIAWLLGYDESLIHMFLYCLAGAAFSWKNYYSQKTYGSDITKYITEMFNFACSLKSNIVHLTFYIVAFSAIGVSEFVVRPQIRVFGIIFLSLLFITIIFISYKIVHNMIRKH